MATQREIIQHAGNRGPLPRVISGSGWKERRRHGGAQSLEALPRNRDPSSVRLASAPALCKTNCCGKPMRLARAWHVHAGFTLVELAVVIFVIALLTGGIVAGAFSLIQSGRTQDAMKMATDLASASQDFRQRYHYLPGDFPVTAAAPQIPGTPAVCVIGGANAGNGDGLIQLAESACVPEHLSKAGYIKGSVNPATGLIGIRTSFGPVRFISNAASGVAAGANPLPATIRNVIEYANLPCDVAVEIDGKLDDGNLATGNVRASVATCTPSTLNDPVPFFAIGF